MNEIADAYEIIDEAEKKFPDTIDVIYYRALIERDIAFSKKDDSFLNLAVHHFMQCLKMAPDNPAICYETGMILTQIADYEKALPLLLKAYDLNPSFDRIQILLAVANYGVGNKKIAYEHLNLARSTMSDTADDIFFTIFPNISPFEEV
jgi:tetratricopeptide (TPR) repeat protein